MAEKTPTLRELMTRAEMAQIQNAQKYHVQLALISLVASPRKWEAS